MDATSSPVYPLFAFYERAEIPPPDILCLIEEELPEPQQDLLAHNKDMTSTLERFYNEKVWLEVLKKREWNAHLEREVVLITEKTKRPVEFGAIKIALERFDTEPRREIEEGVRPLGGILELHRIEYTSCPTGFFRIESDDVLNSAFGIESALPLYGRCNRLLDAEEELLAEVVEILPPMRDAHDPGL